MRRRMQIIFQDPFGSLNPPMTVAETLLLHSAATERDATSGSASCSRTAASWTSTPALPARSSPPAPRRRPRASHATSAHRLRRAGVRPRRLSAGTDLQPAAGPAAAVRHRQNLHQPRPRCRPPCRPARRGHVSRPDRRAGRNECDLRAPAPPLHPQPDRRRPTPRPGHPRDAPSALAPPRGCAFHMRCPIARDRCSKERPELRPLDGRDVACHYGEEASAAAQATANSVSPWLAARLAVLRRASEGEPNA